MQQKISKNEECTHCRSYVAEHLHADTQENLCGNCELKPLRVRESERKYAHAIAEGRKRADAAAKQTYLDELRKANEEAAAIVTGTEDKKARSEGAK